MAWRMLAARLGVVLLGFVAAEAALAQDASVNARCVSIANIDERIECLESKGATLNRSTPESDRPLQARTGPSFDCRAAATSIERAICADPDLSDWDARMGQQYQQAVRLRNPADAQALLQSQRSWIIERNSACASVPGNAVWSCIMDVTKKRIATLSERHPTTIVAAPTPPNPPSQLAPSQPDAANLRVQQNPPPTIAPKINAPSPEIKSDGSNGIVGPLFVIAAITGGIVVFNGIRRRERERAERRRLVDMYGETVADRILSHEVWQGMTERHLIESWGNPADRDQEIKHSKVKETWKYGQTGRNRFRSRVFLENGVVIGWKQ